MKILLISTNRNALPMPVMPVGACLVAAAAERAGHTVQFLDLMFTRNALDAIATAVSGFQPDVVGLSIRNIDNVDMRNPVFFLDDLQGLVQSIRTRTRTGAPIILGGAALGVMPEAILRLSGADCAVIGAGEMVFPQLLEQIAQGAKGSAIPGVAWIEPGGLHKNSGAVVAFPASCAVPDYHRWLDLAAYRSQLATVPIQTKIGCRFQCVYCTYPEIEGRTCRLKDPGSVAAAVAQLAASGLRDIEIVDSVFNAPREHALAVCAALSRVKHQARLQCLELNPRDFDDALVTAMERAGFAGMGITLESASERVLQGLRKGFGRREVRHAAEVVRRHPLPCAWIFLFGGPGETPETVRETLQFAEDHIRPSDVAFFNTGIRIYPGTELEAIARQQGVLALPPEALLAPVFYLSPQVAAAWIENAVKQSMARHMNFFDIESLSLSFLPAINRIGSRLGLRPPLWKHLRLIRRGLRLAGMDA